MWCRTVLRGLIAVLLAIVVMSFGGCSSGGGSSNQLADVGDFRVPEEPADNTRRSPVAIDFALFDRESNPVDVELAFVPVARGGDEILVDAAFTDGPLTGLSSAPRDEGGVSHRIEWDFAAQLGSESFVGFGRWEIRLLDKKGRVADVATLDDAILGNDAPTLSDVVPVDAGPSTVLAVSMSVADSSSDEVSILAEYDIGDGYLPATWAGGDSAPVVAASADGSSFQFLWDAAADLGTTEHDVMLRFTPRDPVVDGVPVETGTVRFDNNQPPVAAIDVAALLLSPDRRRGIPIPFRVYDAESDHVDVLFQWRRPDQSFDDPELVLPGNPDELRALLGNEAERQRLQLCREVPLPFHGLAIAVPGGDDSVQLPEIASTASALLGRGGLPGQTLEILRDPLSLERAAGAWSTNHLVAPIRALPMGEGAFALVLDRPGPDQWNLLVIDLATGERVRSVLPAPLPGDPLTMCQEPDADSVLVALDLGGSWQVQRVDVPTGARQIVGVPRDPSHNGIARGLVALSDNTSLLSVGTSLIWLEYEDINQGQSIVVCTGLAEPWGLARHPVHSSRILVAERGADRILDFDVDTRIRLPLASAGGGSSGIPSPTSLAWETDSHLLVVTDEDDGDGSQELRMILPAAGATAVPWTIKDGLPEPVGDVSSGADLLRIVALSSEADLAVSGGVKQLRHIVQYDPTRRVATVDAPFDPPLSGPTRWRVYDWSGAAGSPGVVPADVGGRDDVFLWDSHEAGGAHEVMFRMVPFDTDVGLVAETEVARPLIPAIEVTPRVLRPDGSINSFLSGASGDLDGDGDIDMVGGRRDRNDLHVFFQSEPGVYIRGPELGGNITTLPVDVAVADLDGDGDQDVISVNRDHSNTAIFLQSTPGEFEEGFAVGNGSITQQPVGIDIGDLDGDGDVDLVVANEGSEDLRLFFQAAPGAYAIGPAIGGPSVTAGVQDVAVGDVDRDGDLDIISANGGSDDLTIFLQVGPGVFTVDPAGPYGGVGTTSSPGSVAIADLDGDGDLDIAVGNDGDGTVAVFFQTVAGTFTSAPGPPLGWGETTAGTIAITIADLNGDDRNDIVTVTYENSRIAAYLQSAPGSFVNGPAFIATGAAQEPRTVTVDDLDGDGDAELVTANTGGQCMTVYFQADATDFADGNPLPIADEAAWPRSVAVGDLDGDGDTDLLTANATEDRLGIIWQTDPGVFLAGPAFSGPGTTRNPYDVALADLDGDGDLDAVTANRRSSTLTLFTQSTPGVFMPSGFLGSPETTDGPRDVDIIDLDHDGDLDIVTANQFGSSVTIFDQVAPGEFVLGQIVDLVAGVDPFEVLPTDLDGDGDLDLVTANEASDNLTLFFQGADGSFSAGPILGGAGITEKPEAVTAGDFDLDGDVDLACANFEGDNVTIFLQTEPGVYVDGPVLGNEQTTREVRSLLSVDIDQDGDDDLITGNQRQAVLAVFLQSSPGVFQSPRYLFGAWRVSGVTDLDGDGDPDILGAGGGSIVTFYGGH